uniref:Lipoprotein n=1 Tax=uncultured Chloroflexota bacterium TaxID=166587 RepID=H5SMX7_9CHLR|nr:hypothetical protein HGMM_F51C01C33 [uncultured Chloroflexota bacterium]
MGYNRIMAQRCSFYKVFPLLFLVIGMVACQALPTPQVEATVAMAVAATLTAWPTPTIPPTPRSSPTPTATPFTLQGLFCEYRFCTGHPAGVAFYDLQAVQDQQQPSQVMRGMLVAYRDDLLILLQWQEGEAPQTLVNSLLDARFDTALAEVAQRTLAGWEVWFLPIQTVATLTLPYGAIAAWQCGTRAFGWKSYTQTTEQAENLLQEALGRFRCE